MLKNSPVQAGQTFRTAVIWGLGFFAAGQVVAAIWPKPATTANRFEQKPTGGK